MLSNFETGIITLLNNALKGEKQTLPEDFDYNLAYELGKKHQIIPILYYGGAHIEGFASSPIGVQFLMSTMHQAAFSENQLLEINNVCSEFDKNGIEYMKLKGSILKKLYPQPEMRMMSDADILIKEEQESAIEKVVKDLGYTFVQNSDHEWIWEKDTLALELHRRIIATYQKDYYAYFGDGWRLAKKNESATEYEMSKEDEFIYLFTHLAKHYRDSGIGIKHITDIYVFLKNYNEIDMDYIERELDNLKLLTFFNNVKKTVNVWFNGEKSDEVSDFITAKIFESGAYGTQLAYLKAEAVRYAKNQESVGKARKKKRMRMIFPPYRVMKNVFPVLRKVPILLPFLWIWRIIRAVLFRQDNIKAISENLDVITEENINEVKCELDFVGLDFNFEV
jgi:hypothetical protein